MAVRKPDLSTVLKNAMSDFSKNLHVMMPAKIVEYDETKQLAKVQPLFQNTSTINNAEPLTLPQLFEVPVKHTRVGLAVIYLPIRPGDKVGLVFADRSLDNWQNSLGNDPLDPQDLRSHDLTDGWAIPGMYPPDDPILNVDPADIRIILFDIEGNVRSQFYLGGDTGDIVLLPENITMLGDAQATEAAVLGNAFMSLFNTHTHATAGTGTPSPPVVPMSVTELATKVNVK